MRSGSSLIGDRQIDDVEARSPCCGWRACDRAVREDVDRPSPSRSTMVRRLNSSTSPPVPLIAATSPTRTWSSRIRKKPLMMSRTSVCAPKPTARPAMPAPVSTGAMSMWNSLQDHQHGDADDEHRRDLADHGAQRARALGPLQRVEPVPRFDVVLEAPHHQAGGADESVGEQARCSQDPQAGAERSQSRCPCTTRCAPRRAAAGRKKLETPAPEPGLLNNQHRTTLWPSAAQRCPRTSGLKSFYSACRRGGAARARARCARRRAWEARTSHASQKNDGFGDEWQAPPAATSPHSAPKTRRVRHAGRIKSR